MNINTNNNNITNLRKNISEFINSQNIIGTISGVTIAVSAGNTIRSFVNEIIFPTFYYIFRKNLKVSDFSPISYKHICLFLKEFITFIFVLILTFYFVKSIMARLFYLKPIGSNAVVVNNNRGGAAAAVATVD